MLCLVALSCPILCDPMDCSPPGSSGHEASPGEDTGVGCHALLSTQGSNPGPPHCRRILYHLRHQGALCTLCGVVALVAASCPTLRDPMDCGPPGSSVHRILQARKLEWVAMRFSTTHCRRGQFGKSRWTLGAAWPQASGGLVLPRGSSLNCGWQHPGIAQATLLWPPGHNDLTGW